MAAYQKLAAFKYILIVILTVTLITAPKTLGAPVNQEWTTPDPETTPSPTTTARPIYSTTLDTAEAPETEWAIPPLTPKWLEYYLDSDDLRNPTGGRSCASLVSSAAQSLAATDGIWSTCQDPNQAPPSITYTSEDRIIVSITTRFYLHGEALIRLHVGNTCFDYSDTEDAGSSCTFMRIRSGEIFWKGAYQKVYPNQQVSGFRMELVSRASGDVILLDKITVEYMISDGCSSQPTTTETSTMETESKNPTTMEDTVTTVPVDPSTITGEVSMSTTDLTTKEVDPSTGLATPAPTKDSEGTTCTTDVPDTSPTTTTTTTTPTPPSSSACITSNLITITLLLITSILILK